jgi:site-specific DNA recombinase
VIFLRFKFGSCPSDLSIPDKQRQLNAYCTAKGWQVAGEFIDAGLSGTDDKRPQMQRLLDLATGGGGPFDVVRRYQPPT